MKRFKTILLLFLLWLSLTAVGVTSWILASSATQGGFSPRWESVVKGTANVLDLFAAPGWFVARAAGIGARGAASAAFAHAASWLAFVVLGALLWRWASRARSPSAVAPGVSSPGEPSGRLSRRVFMARAACVAPAGLGVAGVVYGAGFELVSLSVRRYRVRCVHLEPAFDGFRIALLTDTHLGRRVSSSHIRDAVRAALDLAPNVFVLGGDYVDHTPGNIEPSIDLFRPLVATGRPVLGVLGNHDYYADAPRTRTAMKDRGVIALVNGRRFVAADGRLFAEVPDGPALCIAGIDDLWEGAPDISAALHGVPDACPRVLISHNPDVAEQCDAATPRVDLMLSGHTHGGQVSLPIIGPPIVPSRYGAKYARGLVAGPRFPVVVSAGVGTTIAPIRMGVPPEVVEITLTRASG